MTTVHLLEKSNICPLCRNLYDQLFQKPIKICPSNHTICQRCLSDMLTGNSCPFCHKIIPFKLFKTNLSQHKKTQKQIKYAPNTNCFIINNTRPLQAPPQIPAKNTQQFFNRQKWYQDENQPQKQKYKKEDQQLDEKIKTIKLQQQQQQRKSQIITFFIQLAFTFCNILFSLYNSQIECMDQIHGSFALRPWLLGIGIAQSILMALLCLNILIYRINCIDKQIMQFNQSILIAAKGLKMIVWAAVEFDMYQNGLMNHCKGFIYPYLYIITLINVSLGILIFLLTGICILGKGQ